MIDTSIDESIPKIIASASFDHPRQSSISLSSHQEINNHQNDEFAFLKRQHQLKESLADHKNSPSGHQHQLADGGEDNDSVISTSDTFGSSSSSSVNGGTGIKCRNSIQGKFLIADDRGYVCPRRAVGVSGCCANSGPSASSTRLYSCDTCHQEVGCCAIYEHCISCCMSPTNRELLNRLVAERKSAVFKIFIASITDYFELCLTKCRTSSASVQHENTYRNPGAKHCYSDNVQVVAVVANGDQ